jgi:glycosyltransferase involved in cell wall biosynthesis
MVWFVEEIMPRIERAVPEATLTIVGRNPTARVQALAEGRPRVTVTGTVKDVRPYLEAASVVVVPLRVGGGTRIKIYEAMGMERAVVSTTIGAEGLDVRDGTHLVLADDAAAFADAVIELLRSPERAAEIGRTAAAHVRTHFGWASVAEQFAERAVHPQPAAVDREHREAGARVRERIGERLVVLGAQLDLGHDRKR